MTRNKPSTVFLLALVSGLLLLSACEKEPVVDPIEKWGSVYSFDQLTDSDFLEKTRKGVSLVVFDADWCGWCRKLDPHLAAFTSKMGDKVQVYKIDYDKNPEARRYFGVAAPPTLIVIQEGKWVRYVPGYVSEEELYALVADLVKTPGDEEPAAAQRAEDEGATPP